MTVRLPISVARINGPGRLLFTRNIGHKAATIIPANEASVTKAAARLVSHRSFFSRKIDPLIAAKDETIKVLTKAESNAAALIAAKDETINNCASSTRRKLLARHIWGVCSPSDGLLVKQSLHGILNGYFGSSFGYSRFGYHTVG